MFKFIKTKLLNEKEKVSAPSFFDYTAAEKKKIVKKAAQEANKMQLNLVKKYNRLYPA
ncbi:hypothetical protein HY383_04140 [Candidatus Daviesbacteria bacterium]|nr:hypothetical protein [Candidatus Daviesbacteria bacterium]